MDLHFLYAVRLGRCNCTAVYRPFLAADILVVFDPFGGATPSPQSQPNYTYDDRSWHTAGERLCCGPTTRSRLRVSLTAMESLVRQTHVCGMDFLTIALVLPRSHVLEAFILTAGALGDEGRLRVS